MKIVGSDVDIHSDDFKQNNEKMQNLNKELEEIVYKSIDVG